MKITPRKIERINKLTKYNYVGIIKNCWVFVKQKEDCLFRLWINRKGQVKVDSIVGKTSFEEWFPNEWLKPLGRILESE